LQKVDDQKQHKPPEKKSENDDFKNSLCPRDEKKEKKYPCVN